jgi:ADP-heptose:LPS heptosyltransferase
MKILMIRPEMIGDTILLTPIISALKYKFPEAQIYLLMRPGMEEVIKNNPEVAGHILLTGYLELLRKIKAEKFDMAIVLEDNPTPKWAYLTLLAGIPKRLGDKSRLLYGWIYNRGVWINSADPELHHIELYLKLLEPLGIKGVRPPLKLNPDPEADKKIEKLMPAGAIGIHIGTGGGNRALLPKTYAQIVNLLSEKTKRPIVLLGGVAELETLKNMKNYLHAPYIDLVNKLSLQELFSVVKRLALFIGVDSGPLHATAAFKVPIVALYTAKDVNPNRWLPWQTKYLAIKSPPEACQLKCSHRECQKDYCLKAIKAEQVVEAARELLK